MTAPASSDTSALIEVRDLACERGGRSVFRGVSLSVRAGEMLAVKGANGTGKSSLLRVLAGLLRPHAGTARIAGGVHHLGHLDALKDTLSVRENLMRWRDGTSDPADAAGIVGLAHALDLPAGVLSAGQRRRAALARLLLAPRGAWLLDEPTAALDRDGAVLLGRLMQDHLAGGGAILAATHDELPLAPARTLRLGPGEASP